MQRLLVVMTTISGASWWDYSLTSKTASRQCWVAGVNGRPEDLSGGCILLQVFIFLFFFCKERGCAVAWWPASCSLDSTAACSGGGRVVTAQNALPLTPNKTVILPRDSLRVGRRARCTYRFLNALNFPILLLCVEALSDSECRLAFPEFPAWDMSSNCTSAAPVSASKTKTKKKHFIGQKVKLFRASEPILSVLMWGVNHTVSTC